MRLDGTLRQRRVHRGERHGECHYSILRDEWQRTRSGRRP
jgi:RimJ/RimL family protein N-acetyltransferase